MPRPEQKAHASHTEPKPRGTPSIATASRTPKSGEDKTLTPQHSDREAAGMPKKDSNNIEAVPTNEQVPTTTTNEDQP